MPPSKEAKDRKRNQNNPTGLIKNQDLNQISIFL